MFGLQTCVYTERLEGPPRLSTMAVRVSLSPVRASFAAAARLMHEDEAAGMQESKTRVFNCVNLDSC